MKSCGNEEMKYNIHEIPNFINPYLKNMNTKAIFLLMILTFLGCKEDSKTDPKDDFFEQKTKENIQKQIDIQKQIQKVSKKLNEKAEESEKELKESEKKLKESSNKFKKQGEKKVFDKFEMDSTMKEANIIIKEY